MEMNASVCSAQGFSVWTRKSGPTSECCLFSVTPYLRSETHVNSNSHIATRRKTKISFQDGICLWLFYVVLSLPKGTLAFYTMTLQNNSNAPSPAFWLLLALAQFFSEILRTQP